MANHCTERPCPHCGEDYCRRCLDICPNCKYLKTYRDMMLRVFAQFKEPIIEGRKQVSIRRDIHRKYKPGHKLHFWTVDAAGELQELIAEGSCRKVEDFTIIYNEWRQPMVRLAGESLTHDELLELAQLDGFSSLQEFYSHWNQDFTGRAVFWDPREMDIIK